MTIDNSIKDEYFCWIVKLVFPNDDDQKEYLQLLKTLYFYEYVPSIDRDENRRLDGLNLRSIFAEKVGIPEDIVITNLNEPCTILEMMASLANRIEDTIMFDPDYGNRIDIWFKEMLDSLGLLDQTNYNFNRTWVDYRIQIFNNRQYEVNGRGSLFTSNDPNVDMRDMEIWYQMQQFISEYDKYIGSFQKLL